MRQVTCAHARKSLATPISRVGFGSTYAEKTSGMAKRPAGGATCESSVRSKHRKTGSDPRWASDFPWMVVVDSDGEGRHAWHAAAATVSRWIGAARTVLEIVASGATSTHLCLKFSYLEIELVCT